MVEIMCSKIDHESKLSKRVRFVIAFLKPCLELTLRMFDGTIIRGIICRAVERQDALVCQEFLDGIVIQVAAVIEFEEQRFIELDNKLFQVCRHLMAPWLFFCGKRRELISGGKILYGQHIRFSGRIGKLHFKDIHGPYSPHLDRIKREIASEGGDYKDIEVNCYNFNELLDNQGISHIDYLNIDVEGGEYKILNSIDFDRVKISVIGVENNYKNPNIPKLLMKKGFVFHSIIGDDDFYLNRLTV